MAKGYTTKQAVENYTLQNIASSFTAQITSWIEAIEQFIDQRTGRNFVADSVATTRVYDGIDDSEIDIDDFISITKLEVGEELADRVEIIAADYRTYPANETPKQTIQLKDSYFTEGHQNVVVTAKFGYSATCPADITLAATILMAGIINYSNNAKGKVQSETIGRYSVTYNSEKGWQDFKNAMAILDSYKKFEF